MKESNLYSFDAFCPRLRNGRLIPQGKRIIYETTEPFNQIVLPIELADLIALSNGRFSMREIIEKMYQRQGYVHFRSLFETVQRLQLGGFLENGNELALNQKLPKSEPDWIESLKFELPFLKRLSNDSKNPVAFYFCAMFCILAGLFSFILVPSPLDPLFLAQKNYSFLKGLAFLWLSFSVLASFKHLTKMILLLFLTGKVYNLHFSIRPWGFHFQVGDESQFLVQTKVFLLLYHFALMFSPFSLVAISSTFLNSDSLIQVFFAAILVFLFQMNPYTLGQLTQMFKNLFDLDGNPHMSAYFGRTSILNMLDPYGSSLNKKLRIVFRWLPLAWSFSALMLFSWLISPHLSFHQKIPKTAHVSEFVLGSIVLIVLLLCWNYCLYQTVKSIYFSFIAKPIMLVWDKVKGLKPLIVKSFNHDEVLKMIHELPLFSSLSEGFLKKILISSDVVRCKRGDIIVREHEESLYLYVLLAGKVDISRHTENGRKWLSSVFPVSIFGESALVNHEKRTADAICTETSLILRIPASTMREIATDNQYVRDLESFKGAIVVSQFFSSAPMFRELPENVREMLIHRSKMDYFSTEETIFQQGSFGDRFYMILRGSVDVYINETKLKKIKQGGFFGEIAVIAAIPRTATIRAAEPSLLLSIQVDAFWEILVQHLELALFIEYVGEQRFKEGLEMFHNETLPIKVA